MVRIGQVCFFDSLEIIHRRNYFETFRIHHLQNFQLMKSNGWKSDNARFRQVSILFETFFASSVRIEK